jgi:hypothetical protein
MYYVVVGIHELFRCFWPYNHGHGPHGTILATWSTVPRVEFGFAREKARSLGHALIAAIVFFFGRITLFVCHALCTLARGSDSEMV